MQDILKYLDKKLSAELFEVKYTISYMCNVNYDYISPRKADPYTKLHQQSSANVLNSLSIILCKHTIFHLYYTVFQY